MLIKFNLKGNHLFVIYRSEFKYKILSLFHCSIFNGYPGMQCGKIFVFILYFFREKKVRQLKQKYLFQLLLFILKLFYCGLHIERVIYLFITLCGDRNILNM